MDTVCKKNHCNGCMACVDICPKGCISVEDDLFYLNAVKNADTCIHCGACEKVCPNNHPVDFCPSVEWHQGWACEEIRLAASSGGAASAITRAFLRNGGYAASCIFEEGEFRFEITNSLESAQKFAGSKYVKSNPAGIYKAVQEKLKENRVLFIGLPCQVAGLKNFIKDQTNLYTVDLICHGTPSPKVLKTYLNQCGYDLRNLDSIAFRYRNTFGLNGSSIHHLEQGTDSYLISFLNGISYTENCYSCQFARRERVSDLTLGDSWGTDLKHEEKKGISLILIQSEKGKALLSEAELELHDVDYENAVRANHQLNHPSDLKPERERFLAAVSEGRSIKQSVGKLLPKEVLKQRIKYYLVKLGLSHKWEIPGNP